MTLVLRQTPNARLNHAFDVLAIVGQWLTQRGRRQRIAHTSFETYESWQRAGGNYCIMCGGDIAGVFTVVEAPFDEWPDIREPTHALWLRALATHPAYRGSGVGAFGISAALQIARPQPLYLDCVSDFLPMFYAAHGFEALSRRVMVYPDDGEYDVTLMGHANASGSQ